jgi:hypothetical protein
VVGEDPTVLGETSVAKAWNRMQRSRRVCMDPAVVAEARRWWTRQEVSEASTVDPTAVGEVTVVQALRQSRSGCTGGMEMIVVSVRV